MMDWITHLVWIDGKFLGIEWHLWKVIGWIGNIVFSCRFFVQWWATERKKQVVIPNAFWWLSLFGSLCLLTYGLHQRDSVFIFAYAFTWIPYIRSLMISHNVARRQHVCAGCFAVNPPQANFCSACGGKLTHLRAEGAAVGGGGAV